MNDAPRPALIIGAAGQVGRQLAVLLSPTGAVLTSRQARTGWHSIDLEKVLTETGLGSIPKADFSAVYCVGGATDVEGCEVDPDWALRINAFGPARLAGAFSNIPFVYFSSDYVFDGESGPYRESDQSSPLSAYGKSKLLGEQLIQTAHPSALIVRTTAVFGPDPRMRNFPASIASRLTKDAKARVPIDQFSTPTYSEDLAIATVGLVAAKATGVFHVCGDDYLSRYQWAVEIADALGLDPAQIEGCETKLLGQRAARPLRGGLVSERLRTVLPDVRLRCLSEGIMDWANAERSALTHMQIRD